MTEHDHDHDRDAIVVMFDVFRKELDESNDTRERLIKLSREITTKSKRVIFALHRSSEISKMRQDSTTVVTHLFSEIKRSFQEVSAELQNENFFWRYHRVISPGLQEYIEALSFAKYLETRTLLSFNDVQQDLRIFLPLGVPYSDYLLGVSDLTGELMRFAITSVGSQGLSSREVLTNALSICNFVRDCRASWDPMSANITELRSKQEVTTTSLRKIEEVVYSLSIRGLNGVRIGDIGAVPITQSEPEGHDYDND